MSSPLLFAFWFKLCLLSHICSVICHLDFKPPEMWLNKPLDRVPWSPGWPQTCYVNSLLLFGYLFSYLFDIWSGWECIHTRDVKLRGQPVETFSPSTVCSGDPTQVFRLNDKPLYPLNHLATASPHFYKNQTFLFIFKHWIHENTRNWFKVYSTAKEGR